MNEKLQNVTENNMQYQNKPKKDTNELLEEINGHLKKIETYTLFTAIPTMIYIGLIGLALVLLILGLIGTILGFIF